MVDLSEKMSMIECNQKKGGSFMADSQRLQITVSKSTLERLLAICGDKGLSRSAGVSLAIDKLWKEEYADKQK